MRLHRKIAHLLGYELFNKKQLGHLTAAAHIRTLFETLQVSHVIDAGANHGQYGQQLRELGFSGDIFSFEPVSSNFTILKSLCNHDPRWHCFNYALGATETTTQINVTDSTVFASLYEPNVFSTNQFGAKNMRVSRQETIQIKRLDNIIKSLLTDTSNPRIFLKMDTQGHDLEVFKGASEIMHNVVGLQSELAVMRIYNQIPDYITSLSFYKQHGFEPSGIYPVSRDHHSQIVIEYDCFMVRLKDH